MGVNGPLFDYASQPATEAQRAESSTEGGYDPLSRPGKSKTQPRDEDTEGYSFDPNLTKVVDRRWYEKNKHIFPASIWEEYEPSKDYSTGIRKDTEGNAFFFS